jgi:hypothetical protein
MLRLLLSVAVTAALVLTTGMTFSAQAPKAAATIVVLETVKGTIEIETLPADSPKSVARFVELAQKAFYRGQRFHYVQPHLVQTGDLLVCKWAESLEIRSRFSQLYKISDHFLQSGGIIYLVYG